MFTYFYEQTEEAEGRYLAEFTLLTYLLKYIKYGEMQEWLNWPLSKSGKAVTSSRVQIPYSPPNKIHLFGCILFGEMGFEPDRVRIADIDSIIFTKQ